MKFRNLLALAVTTATLFLAPLAHANDISDGPDPTTGLGAPIAKNVKLAKLIYNTDLGLYNISVSYSIATAYVPEESYIYFGDKQNHVYSCHNFPATTAMVNLTCDVYNGKK